MIHHALTAMLTRHMFTLDDGRLWSVVEFDMHGHVLMRREADDPSHYIPVYMSDDPYDYEMLQFPGCAYHRWFDASVLSEAAQRMWSDREGW